MRVLMLLLLVSLLNVKLSVGFEQGTFSNMKLPAQNENRFASPYASVPLKNTFIQPQQQIRSVTVTCFPATMQVQVHADFFHLGIPVNPADLRLGTQDSSGLCGVAAFTPELFIFNISLTDCGTQYQLTNEALIYKNLLIYSPAPSAPGLVRLEEVTVPVECHYARRFGVKGDPVVPTWIPHQSLKSFKQTLKLSLHLMNSDWQTESDSRVFYLGDVIKMEAAVVLPQINVHVFVDSCVATTPVASAPSYKFIENGCFVDGKLPGSRSHFLPRRHSNKLQMQLDAFVFHQIDSSQILISCVLQAEVLSPLKSNINRACSFIHKQWRSADGDDRMCEVCRGKDEFTELSQSFASPFLLDQNFGKSFKFEGFDVQMDSAPQEEFLQPTTTESTWKKGSQGEKDLEGVQQEASIGPLSLITRSKKGVMLPSEVREGVNFSHNPLTGSPSVFDYQDDEPDLEIKAETGLKEAKWENENSAAETLVSPSELQEPSAVTTAETKLASILLHSLQPTVDPGTQPPPETPH